jgi:hypothetical protein
MQLKLCNTETVMEFASTLVVRVTGTERGTLHSEPQGSPKKSDQRRAKKQACNAIMMDCCSFADGSVHGPNGGVDCKTDRLVLVSTLKSPRHHSAAVSAYGRMM